MLIVMHHSATDEQVHAVTDAVEAMGLVAAVSYTHLTLPTTSTPCRSRGGRDR